jgi:N-acetylglutamate synthase-like GNAT family acetyltransferase
MNINYASYEISDDKSRLQLPVIHSLLTQTYWSKGIPKSTVEAAIEGSLCFGVYKRNEQVGFARVVTDSATFAWLCDVIIQEQHRGKGLSKELMKIILSHPKLQGLRRICLATKDAHELYRQFGFKVTETPQNWMEIKDNDIYVKRS